MTVRRIIAGFTVILALVVVGGVTMSRASASSESQTWTTATCRIVMPTGTTKVTAQWHNSGLTKTGVVWIDARGARGPQLILRDRVGPYRGAGGFVGFTHWTVPTVGFYSQARVTLKDSWRVRSCTTR